MKLTHIFLTTLLTACTFLLHAQTEEQYKAWHTPSYQTLLSFIEENQNIKNENETIYNFQVLNKAYETLEKDPKNPLILRIIGEIASIFAHNPPAEDDFKSSSENSNPTSRVLNLMKQNQKDRDEDKVTWSTEALDKFKQAANHNENESMMALANFYRHGYYVLVNEEARLIYDIEKTINWLNKAILLGNINAGITLGELYIKGEGVPEDITKGEKLIEKAFHIPQTIYYEIGYQYAISPYADSNSKPHEYHYDPKKALYFLTKAADLDQEDAALFLGKCYGGYISENRFKFTSLSEEKSFHYLNKASSNATTTAEAYYLLATCYLRGKGTKKDTNKAIFMFEELLKAENELNKDELKKQIEKFKSETMQ